MKKFLKKIILILVLFITINLINERVVQAYDNSGIIYDTKMQLAAADGKDEGNKETKTDSANPANSEDETNTLTNSQKIIKIIKDAIAKWYYIMRLMVITIMLLLLIFIGIKMAISSIASEKALYKQMLIDWVAGMIIVFTIHYIMIAIITINEAVVNALHPMVEVDMRELAPEETYGYLDPNEKETASDVETTLYESARTRAYDVKMTNGFTGMFIYGALVFYAWRFALMYFKRLINVIILTLLAPFVAGSYAFNKILSGKSKIFSAWFKEYFINVVIQLVHVIIYVSFITTVLRLSMLSIPSILLAFVLLNFMIKADKILRQIFNLSGGAGSLSSSMADHSTFGDLKKDFKSMTYAMAGSKITKDAIGMTYKAVSKPARAVAEIGFGEAMKHRAKRLDKQKEKNEGLTDKENKEKEKIQENFGEWASRNESREYRDKLKMSKAKMKTLEEQKKSLSDQIDDLEQERQLMYYGQGEDGIFHVDGDAEMEENQRKIDELVQKRDEIEGEMNNEMVEMKVAEAAEQDRLQQEYLKAYISSGTTGGNISAGLSKLFNPYDYVKKGKDGKYHRIRTEREGGNNKAFWRKKKKSIGMQFLKNAKLTNLLGISEAEEKVLKEELKQVNSSVLGVISGIAGMATLGATPKLGMGLLAQSAITKANLSDRHRQRKTKLRMSKSNGSSYKFKEFSDDAKTTMENEVKLQIKEAESRLTKRNMIRHKKLVKKLTDTTRIFIRPAKVGAMAIATVSLGARVGSINPNEDENGKKGNIIRFTSNEEQKLADLQQKKIREELKLAKKRILIEETRDLENSYTEAIELYEDSVKQQNDEKTIGELFAIDAVSEGNAVVVGNVVMQVQSDDAIEKFVNETAELDNKDDMSDDNRISIIKDEIKKRETELIESAIVKVSLSQGIIDVNDFELNNSDVKRIEEALIGGLEDRGIIKKGEIELNISKQKVRSVLEDMKSNPEKTNEKVESNMAQQAILEYMANNGISDSNALNTEEAREEIFAIIAGNMLSDDSKKSADVIKNISGQDVMTKDVKIPTSLQSQVEKLTRKVKKVNKTSALMTDSSSRRKILLERQVNRECNETKRRLESAVAEDDSSGLNEGELQIMFLLAQLELKRNEAEKVGLTKTPKKDVLELINKNNQNGGV